eukprot:TRINITY_DN21460_c0_g1_i4.p1 TRINITY_DN21460_c0_g1~~TRINITY_DN21460_c0_g1_i4.p1  ORF type:complete len:704 (+),score=126.70 TRINITY_DN21460_c0_g1_i4:231-2342(+)
MQGRISPARRPQDWRVELEGSLTELPDGVLIALRLYSQEPQDIDREYHWPDAPPPTMLSSGHGMEKKANRPAWREYKVTYAPKGSRNDNHYREPNRASFQLCASPRWTSMDEFEGWVKFVAAVTCAAVSSRPDILPSPASGQIELSRMLGRLPADVREGYNKLKRGDFFALPSLSSTSVEKEAELGFMGNHPVTAVMLRLRFAPGELRGVNMKDLSMYPQEAEVLLPMFALFQVTSRSRPRRLSGAVKLPEWQGASALAQRVLLHLRAAARPLLVIEADYKGSLWNIDPEAAGFLTKVREDADTCSAALCGPVPSIASVRKRALPAAAAAASAKSSASQSAEGTPAGAAGDGAAAAAGGALPGPGPSGSRQGAAATALADHGQQQQQQLATVQQRSQRAAAEHEAAPLRHGRCHSSPVSSQELRQPLLPPPTRAQSGTTLSTAPTYPGPPPTTAAGAAMAAVPRYSPPPLLAPVSPGTGVTSFPTAPLPAGSASAPAAPLLPSLPHTCGSSARAVSWAQQMPPQPPRPEIPGTVRELSSAAPRQLAVDQAHNTQQPDAAAAQSHAQAQAQQATAQQAAVQRAAAQQAAAQQAGVQKATGRPAAVQQAAPAALSQTASATGAQGAKQRQYTPLVPPRQADVEAKEVARRAARRKERDAQRIQAQMELLRTQSPQRARGGPAAMLTEPQRPAALPQHQQLAEPPL